MEATVGKYLKRSPVILLPALALLALLVSAVLASVASWTVLYRNVVPNAGKREAVWLQYGHHRPPYAIVPLGPAGSFLTSDQNYDITLEFIVPATIRNMKLGNFMVNVALVTADQRTLINVSRPASLQYTNPLALHLAAVSPFSFTQKVQHLSVQLVESGVLQSRNKIPTTAFVELGRQDGHVPPAESRGWNGGEGELQVYKAWLRFDAHLTGLRWLLYYHPIIAFLIFTPSFLLAELLAAFTIWAIIAYRATGDVTAGPGDSLDSASTFSSDDDNKLEDSTRAGIRRRGTGARMTDTAEGGLLASIKSESEEEESVSGETSASGSWQGVEAEDSTPVAVKEEDDDDNSTIGGSETTRGTRSSFGTSLASTRASRSTATTSEI